MRLVLSIGLFLTGPAAWGSCSGYLLKLDSRMTIDPGALARMEDVGVTPADLGALLQGPTALFEDDGFFVTGRVFARSAIEAYRAD